MSTFLWVAWRLVGILACLWLVFFFVGVIVENARELRQMRRHGR